MVEKVLHNTPEKLNILPKKKKMHQKLLESINCLL